MTVSSEVIKAGPFLGDGTTVSLPFGFKAFSENDVLVVSTDPSGVESNLTLTTHYTVTLNPDQDASPGGSVEMVTAPAIGHLTTVGSQVAFTQGVKLTNMGGFYPAVLNGALDRLTILAQQLKEQVGRAVKVGISSSVTPDELVASIVTSEANAAASAAAASGSATAAANSATSAATSASNAATSETNAAASAASAASAVASAIGTTVQAYDAQLDTLSGLTPAQATALLGFPDAGGLGFRNCIINGGFSINQRAYVSGAATTVGQYTLDRWKVTATNGITFSTTANKTTVTIPSGQTIQQVVEGLNLQSGTYVLSWEGTAQGRIAGGAYGASGAVTASVTGGTNTTIEFNAGTVANIQLEIGTKATPFERRDYGQELALCQRYYHRINAGSSVIIGESAVAVSATSAIVAGKFPVTMRGYPTALDITPTASQFNVVTGGVSRVCTVVPTLSGITSPDTWVATLTVASGQTAGQGGYLLTSSGGAYLGWSAEL